MQSIFHWRGIKLNDTLLNARMWNPCLISISQLKQVVVELWKAQLKNHLNCHLSVTQRRVSLRGMSVSVYLEKPLVFKCLRPPGNNSSVEKHWANVSANSFSAGFYWLTGPCSETKPVMRQIQDGPLLRKHFLDSPGAPFEQDGQWLMVSVQGY